MGVPTVGVEPIFPRRRCPISSAVSTLPMASTFSSTKGPDCHHADEAWSANGEKNGNVTANGMQRQRRRCLAAATGRG